MNWVSILLATVSIFYGCVNIDWVLLFTYVCKQIFLGTRSFFVVDAIPEVGVSDSCFERLDSGYDKDERHNILHFNHLKI